MTTRLDNPCWSQGRKCQGRLRTYGECERPASVERDGKWYCWQHDPVKKEQAAREAWKARKEHIAQIEAAADAKIERRQLEEQAGIKNLTNDDLRQLIAAGGMVKILSEIR